MSCFLFIGVRPAGISTPPVFLFQDGFALNICVRLFERRSHCFEFRTVCRTAWTRVSRTSGSTRFIGGFVTPNIESQLHSISRLFGNSVVADEPWIAGWFVHFLFDDSHQDGAQMVCDAKPRKISPPDHYGYAWQNSWTIWWSPNNAWRTQLVSVILVSLLYSKAQLNVS